MTKIKSYVIAGTGVFCFAASVALNYLQPARADTPTVVSSTAHFNPNRTYVLTPSNGASQINCKVAKIDGAWLLCDGNNMQWVNIDTIMFASDR